MMLMKTSKYMRWMNIHTIFSDLHDKVELYKKTDFADRYLSQADQNFGNLMLVKFELIYKELLENDNVVYVDGDIVFKNNLKSIYPNSHLLQI